MYKLFLAATLLASSVSAQYGGESYSGGDSQGAYEAAAGGEYAAEPKMGESGAYAPPAETEMPEMKEGEKSPEQPCEPKPMPGGGMMHEVLVGGDAGLVYVPQSVMAEVGDTVRFHFLKMNHTVTQSSFDKPCVKNPEGEDSNFKPSTVGTMDPAAKEAADPNLVWDYKVTAKEPTWWYCKQKKGTHCGKGMVFAINPNAEKTFDKFAESAQSQNGTGEGAPPPPEGGEYAPPAEGETPPPPPPKMEEGWNAGGEGACSCQCLCGTEQYPSDSGWGAGGKGGMPGYAPAGWAKPEESKPEEPSPPAEGGEYAPPAEGETPAPPAEGGEYAPPAEGETPAPPAEGGETPAPPAEEYAAPEGAESGPAAPEGGAGY